MSAIKRKLEEIQDLILLGNADELSQRLIDNGANRRSAWLLVDDFQQIYGELWEALTTGGNGMRTYNVQTDTYAFCFRANLSEASAPIELLDDEGQWQPTQWQTASVGHCEWEAARQLADDIDSAGGGDPSAVLSVD